MQYTVDNLVKLARRENNTKRSYLYVNPIQGKHIPTDPIDALQMCKTLADIINNTYKDERLYVIGFAETATGIAAGISSYLNNVLYYQNTTREYRDGEEYLYFTESHSHAAEQMLRSSKIGDYIGNVDRIIFIDDEVTTGNTICKLINVFREKFGVDNIRYSIVSILNSMTNERINELKANGTECLFLSKIPHEYKKESITDITFDKERHIVVSADYEPELTEIIFNGVSNPRGILKFSDYENDVAKYADVIIKYMGMGHFDNVLLLGTEEFMYPTFAVGKLLINKGIAENVRIHSTTRSPVLASGRTDYPLYIRYQMRSLYDEDRTTYIYNLKRYDKVLILTDTQRCTRGLWDLCDALKSAGNDDITVIRCLYKN